MDLIWKFSYMLIFYGAIVCARDTIFVADLDNSSIWAAPLDTLEFKALPLHGVVNPIAVDVDPVDHKIYWTEPTTINRANLDGTEHEIILGYLTGPEGMAIDAVNRQIYWTDIRKNTTERANLDGSDRQIIIQDGLHKPRAIVVDSDGGRLFWTDWGANPKIERSNFDGNDRVTLIDTDIQQPSGLAIDFQGERIYWCDPVLNSIETATLNGGDRRNLFRIKDQDGIIPFDIGVYKDEIYWSDWRYSAIIRMNKYKGRQAEAVGTPVFATACGLHIYTDPVDECASNPCYNGGVCIDEILHYQCNCTGTGYEGDACQTDMNECASLPGICDDNAECTNILGSYRCQCRPEYEGNGLTCTVPLPAPGGCSSPGDIEHGYVVSSSGHVGDLYEPGEKVNFVCQDGFSREGSHQIFCQIDDTWSDENPVCEEDEANALSHVAVYTGIGVGCGVLILFLVILLNVVCCRKSRPRNGNESPSLQVTYRTQVSGPKEEGLSNMSNTTIDSQYISNRGIYLSPSVDTLSNRQPAPIPRQSSNHIYDDVRNIPGVAAGATARPIKAPSYIDVIEDIDTDTDRNGYTVMKDFVMLPPPGNPYRPNNLHQ